ncbi:MAG: hypothetical protein ACUVXI_02860 [bacterium]
MTVIDDTSLLRSRAEEAFQQALRQGRGGLLDQILGQKEEGLLLFDEVQRRENAYNKIHRGFRYVPVKKIRGSIQKYKDFDARFLPCQEAVRQRWCNIYIAMESGAPLPAVELYKIKDDYFVYDGNHRVSVANFLGRDFIEANVTEFIPTADTFENVLYRERFNFERKTTLEDVIILTELGQYEILLREIADFGRKIGVEEGENFLRESAQRWYRAIYTPMVEIMKGTNLLENFPGRTYADLYIYISTHKYYESERKGFDVGYDFAIIDFINRFRQDIMTNPRLAQKEFIDRISEGFRRDFRIDPELVRNFNALVEVSSDLREKDATSPADAERRKILEERAGRRFSNHAILISEVEEHQREHDIRDFAEAVVSWYRDDFKALMELFEYKLVLADESYRQAFEKIKVWDEYLYVSAIIYKYTALYDETKGCERPTLTRLAREYIENVFYPAVDAMRDNGVKLEDYGEIYPELLEHKQYLEKYAPKVSFEDAAESFFKDVKRKNLIYRFMQNPMLLRLSRLYDTKEGSLLINDKIKVINEMLEGKREITAYGMPTEFGTLHTIEEEIRSYLERHPEGNPVRWYDEVFEREMIQLRESPLVRQYINNQNLFSRMSGSPTRMSPLDLYALVKSYLLQSRNVHEVEDFKVAAEEYISEIEQFPTSPLKNHPRGTT